MNIIYVHHAERDRTKQPSQKDSITNLGKKDAEIVCELLNKFHNENKISKIYTSEFLRCTQTTEIINQKTNVPVIVDVRLNEHGSNQNESWLDTQNRIASLIKEVVLSSDENDNVVFVTSGINVSVFIAIAFGIPLSKDLPFVGVPSCSPLAFKINKKDFSN